MGGSLGPHELCVGEQRICFPPVLKKGGLGVPDAAQPVKDPTGIHEDAGSMPGLAQWVARSCGVGRRRGLDLALLWLWWRPAATDLIRPLAWESPCAAGTALKRQKKKGEERKEDSAGGGSTGGRRPHRAQVNSPLSPH